MTRRTTRRIPWRRRHRARKGKHFPIALAAAGIAPAFLAVQKEGGFGGIMQNPGHFVGELCYEYTGFSPNVNAWDQNILIRNITMWGAAWLTHWLAKKAGINAALDKIPMIGKYISI